MRETAANITSPPAAYPCVGLVENGTASQVERTIEMICGRWKLPILYFLASCPALRTHELKRLLSQAAQRTLTTSLRELEGDLLVERIDFGERPLHVEYVLTETGRDLLVALSGLDEFSRRHNL